MNTPDFLRFDTFELRLRDRTLWRDGRLVPLRARAFDLLLTLAQRPDQTLGKHELLELVWPGRAVEDNNLATQILSLRKALGAGAIVTVAGRGYKLGARPIASVSAPPPAQAPFAIQATPPLFGREEELGRLASRLDHGGCLTLVGAGGVGKTAIARTLLVGCTGATCWVDLADLALPDQVLPAICRAVDPVAQARSLPSLLPQLKGLRLLVLDNAEHLVPEVASCVRIVLTLAPALPVLVTSQRPLEIDGEAVERIQPLALPAAELTDDEAVRVGAVALLVQRIREADPRFALTARSIPMLRDLCLQLDGLPLGLEMVAARVPLLGLRSVHEALEQRFALLRKAGRDVPERHRTLQAALDWSYRLLDLSDQQAFAALGVFIGGFPPATAVAVAWPDLDPFDALDRLAGLVARSLVTSNHQDPPRYHLLETMRSFALGQLAASGAGPRANALHAAALDRVFEALGDGPDAVDIDEARDHAQADMANAGQAIAWARAHDPSMALRLSANVADAAVLGAWRLDALAWLDDCLALAESDGIDARLRALWWRSRSVHLMHASRAETADTARRAVQLCREIGADWDLAQALLTFARTINEPGPEMDGALEEVSRLVERHPGWSVRLRLRLLSGLGYAREIVPDHAAALDAYRHQEHAARKAGLRRLAAPPLMNAANMLRQLGRFDEALAAVQACQAAEEARPQGYVATFCRILELRILFEAGRHAPALEQLAATLAAARRLGLDSALEVATLGLAQAGRLRAAALMVGHTEQTFDERGAVLHRAPHCDIPRAVALMAGRLDGQELDALRARGRTMEAAEILDEPTG